jgi:hypothetical protein
MFITRLLLLFEMIADGLGQLLTHLLPNGFFLIRSSSSEPRSLDIFIHSLMRVAILIDLNDIDFYGN